MYGNNHTACTATIIISYKSAVTIVIILVTAPPDWISHKSLILTVPKNFTWKDKMTWIAFIVLFEMTKVGLECAKPTI